MLNSSSRQRGVTLIELMVAVTLVALVMMLALPSFSEAMQNRQIRSAAESIRSGLQAARTEALRRNRLVTFQMQTGTGWQIGCDTVDATVDANGEQACPALIQKRDPNEGTSQATVDLGKVVASTGAASASPVFSGSARFSPLGRVDVPAGASCTPAGIATGCPLGGDNATFLVKNPTGGACQTGGGKMRCLQISLSATGQVRMCDPAVTTPGDPRLC